MAENNQEPLASAMAALEQAREGFARLPLIGPALWLYARDPFRKFLFVADIDWAILPPVMLDQCHLYYKDGVPSAYFSWALVNEAVAGRMRASLPKIAPHEWRCGEDVWIIDVVAPFGGAEELFTELRQTVLAGRKVSMMILDPETPGMFTVREYPPEAPRESSQAAPGESLPEEPAETSPTL
ncbi:cytolysin-activating lysine-acyltransferase [Propionivibrio dicarboxylicus]|uniref:RTX toxin-activating lysine-acyltransferase n=2 Tax=Propionivibrio dicarboxylicus TaxID=83767 RepID=A0A1G8MFT9_9RHOO|nr:cytolysin-activating lysine-acyltransferase [Propionivibrio dicarboxylicus]